MRVEKKVPEIRFNCFNDEWLSFNLDQITDVYDGTHQTPAYTKSGVMFLSAENIKTLNSQKFISEKAFNEEFKVYPKKNDVLMTRIGDVGTANVVETDDDKAYYVTLALLKYKQLCPYFLKSSIASPYVQRDIWLRTLHIAFPKKINMNEIKLVTINCPPDKRESNEIGNTFQKLDSLINQHQKKHGKLSNIKKAMLEKMFPKQGETIPEIRFKGFSGEWKKKELRQTAIYRNGKAHEKSIDANGHYIVVNSKFVSTNGRVKKHSNEQISPLVINEICFVLSDVPNGKAIARTFLITQNNLYTLNQRIAGVTPNENSHHYFLYILLNRNPYFLKFDDGAKQTNLSVSDVESFTSLYPSVEEQTQIGNYFQKLDALINRHQQQITKLKNIKQACLSKMFV